MHVAMVFTEVASIGYRNNNVRSETVLERENYNILYFYCLLVSYVVLLY